MTTEEDIEEKARAAAQARRQRILDSANNRMDRVAGLQQEDQDSAEGAEEKPKSSSKLAAMRRRRFKKKSAASEEKGEDKSSEEKTKDTSAKDQEKPPEKDETAAPKVVKEEEVIEEVKTPGVQKEEQKKKYMGVAKMRRKMIQEKKKEQAAAAPSTATAAPVPLKSKKSRAEQTADRVAILMHLLIVFLLFAAGLDVGLQKKLDYGSAAVVQTDLAPREAKFRNILPAFVRAKLLGDEEDIVEIIPEPEKQQYQAPEADEFNDSKPHVAKEKNIDPLFQLDLDEYTSGPGLVMSLARAAVFLHRCNLAVFYYGPKRVVTGIANTLNSLVSIPPLLGILALVLRQIVGNAVLGAHLPVKVEEGEKKNDVMSTIATFVSNIFSGMFPTMIGLYKGWLLLRADMYVVVCGLLVGLTWQHSQLVPSSETPGRDEL